MVDQSIIDKVCGEWERSLLSAQPPDPDAFTRRATELLDRATDRRRYQIYDPTAVLDVIRSRLTSIPARAWGDMRQRMAGPLNAAAMAGRHYIGEEADFWPRVEDFLNCVMIDAYVLSAPPQDRQVRAREIQSALVRLSNNLENLTLLTEIIGLLKVYPYVTYTRSRGAELRPGFLAFHYDDLGRPHLEKAPAVVRTLHRPEYWWRGTSIPKHIAMGDFSWDQVNGLPPATYRAAVEIYGYERAIREGHFCLLSEDAYGKLWVLPESTETVVEVVDATPAPDGTRKTYFLPVPRTWQPGDLDYRGVPVREAADQVGYDEFPWINTPHAAVAWTFRRLPHQYNPEIET